MKLSFADFTIDPATRQLHRGGEELHLSPKAFDLLSILVAQRPGVVSKEILRDRLWPGTNVVDANLNNLASEIRSALGDDPQQPRFLRTVHRVGYAFCGAATEAPATPSDRSPRVWLVWNERTIVLKEDAQTLGRDPECAIWIDAPGVSRRHARIRLDADVNATSAGSVPTAVLEDLDSTNGTFVDGRRIRRPVTLEDGQSIRIGQATLTFRAWSAAGQATKRIRRPRP
jgi:DNA-binding winged helix-turn-helix (wHTH) protein